jgi:hypothetical protein
MKFNIITDVFVTPGNVVRKSVMQYFRLICLPVDWSGGHSREVTGDPAGAKSAEEAPGPPRGKRVPGAEINRHISRENQ